MTVLQIISQGLGYLLFGSPGGAKCAVGFIIYLVVVSAPVVVVSSCLIIILVVIVVICHIRTQRGRD